jgi:hypothetical protein
MINHVFAFGGSHGNNTVGSWVLVFVCVLIGFCGTFQSYHQKKSALARQEANASRNRPHQGNLDVSEGL